MEPRFMRASPRKRGGAPRTGRGIKEMRKFQPADHHRRRDRRGRDAPHRFGSERQERRPPRKMVPADLTVLPPTLDRLYPAQDLVGRLRFHRDLPDREPALDAHPVRAPQELRQPRVGDARKNGRSASPMPSVPTPASPTKARASMSAAPKASPIGSRPMPSPAAPRCW